MSKLFLLSVFTIGLGLATTACSSQQYYRNPYHGDRYERKGYDNGYERVRELSYELERTTNYLKETAKNNTYRRSRLEDYLIDKLKDLDHEAGEFAHEVDHNRDLRKSADEFRDVSKKYYAARNALQGFPGHGSYSYFYGDLDRLNSIMTELSRYYGYNSSYDRY